MEQVQAQFPEKMVPPAAVSEDEMKFSLLSECPMYGTMSTLSSPPVSLLPRDTPPPSLPTSCRSSKSSPGDRFSCPLAPPLTTACPTSSSGPRRSPPRIKWTSQPTSPLPTGAPPPLPSSYRPRRSSDRHLGFTCGNVIQMEFSLVSKVNQPSLAL
jgi:hypothetical protein